MKYIVLFLSLNIHLFAEINLLNNIHNACVNSKIAEACFELALVYGKGFGSNKNIKKAKFYYNLSKKYGIEKILQEQNTTKEIKKIINMNE